MCEFVIAGAHELICSFCLWLDDDGHGGDFEQRRSTAWLGCSVGGGLMWSRLTAELVVVCNWARARLELDGGSCLGLKGEKLRWKLSSGGELAAAMVNGCGELQLQTCFVGEDEICAIELGLLEYVN